MKMNTSLKTYQAIDTLGKSQLGLVIKVYDGAIGAFKAADSCYQNNDSEAGFEQIVRARRFVTHLYTTLDSEKGGQIAENLGRLYAFIISQSHVIEATKDSKMIDDIIGILKELRSGWAGIQANQQSRSSAAEVKHTGDRVGKFSTTA